MARDDFSAATRKLIAQRAGYVCAYPQCLAFTTGPSADTTRSVDVGVAAHITAASVNGPRYDASLTAEQRQAAENGIWMCSTHAALIDRDVEQYTTDKLIDWKQEAEERAMTMLGQPRGCFQGKIATASQATRLGADGRVLVEGNPTPYAPIVEAGGEDAENLTCFVSAFVLQFSILKKSNLGNAVVDHLVVTVHETKPVPKYEMLFGAYPADVSLFYVDIEPNNGLIPREFRPTRFLLGDGEGSAEEKYPQPVVIDDNTPAQLALRINATQSGMYLLSVDAEVSSGDERETVSVMPPQWVIFERYEDVVVEESETDSEEPEVPYDSAKDEPGDGPLDREKYTLYRVADGKIEPMGVECIGYGNLRGIYQKHFSESKEMLLVCHGDSVSTIRLDWGLTCHGKVKSWDPSDPNIQCGKRVLVIEKAGLSGRASMPPSQMAISMSSFFRDAVKELVTTNQNGHPHFRYFPEDVDCTQADQFWRLAMNFPRESLPCIVIMNEHEWKSFPLPMTIEEAIALVREHLS